MKENVPKSVLQYSKSPKRSPWGNNLENLGLTKVQTSQSFAASTGIT